MSKIRAYGMLFGLVALMLGSSGCLLRRSIVGIEDHPDRNVTLLETSDSFLGRQVSQFWQCADEGGQLVCSQSCGTASDLACHTISFGYASNL